jgi:pimeloyl-ACP methyl ester carboxylesterase
MPNKKIILALLSLSVLLFACKTVTSLGSMTPTPPPAPTEPSAAIPPEFSPTEPAAEPPSDQVDMQAVLKKLGGQPCQEKTDFTCVTIQVPLDHFDTTKTETLDVVFAVLPATGKRYGMFVQAFPGGPGGEGISSAGSSWYDPSILEHYDLVYFDQRGIGLSGPLACPTAYAKEFLGYLSATNQGGLEGYDTPAEQKALVEDSRAFVKACVDEIGVDPARLKYYGTNQVAEDLETFRQTIGDKKFWLYGVSYGTDVAQTYAAAHADRLAGLILDGTIDLTLTGEESALSQEKAFNDVLVATLKACDADKACAGDLGGDALKVYDALAAKISKNPIAYQFPLPSGKKVDRKFTFNELEFTAAYQMYSLGGRMLFLRALAAAKRGDLVPMARLLYSQATLDPETGAYLGDPTFSDTMFYDVACTDSSYYSGTPDERIAKIIAAGQASNGTVPRLDGSIYSGIDCALWPSAPADVVRAAPLKAEGIPTFVLNATLDPATPFHEGKAVYERLADGYHLYVEGGRHSIYGFGNDCPDQYITDFMVTGKLPDKREIVCQWDPAVIRAYDPILPENASSFADPLESLSAIDTEIQLLPEYYYSDLTKEVSVACPQGGTFTFGPGAGGEAYTFEKCAYLKGFVLTGTGSYNYDESLVTLEVQISGAKTGKLVYTYDENTGSTSVTGEYDGKPIDLTR